MSFPAYGSFLRDLFGCRVYKVSLDVGFTCPTRDGRLGTSGCAYCNGNSFRPPSSNRRQAIERQLQDGMDFLRRRYGAKKFIAYFQSATNTYAPLTTLIPLYETAISHTDIVGVAIGTRPDCVDEEKIAFLRRLAQKCFVTLEYGLQSASDVTLRRLTRGHDVACWRRAVAMTRDTGIYIGTHLILGFPWETREDVLRGAELIAASGIDFLKLHQLHVVRGSRLAEEYERAPFHLPDLDEYAALVADFLERLYECLPEPQPEFLGESPQHSRRVYIERLFATAPPEQLLAPVWGGSRAEIQRRIEAEITNRHSRIPIGLRAQPRKSPKLS